MNADQAIATPELLHLIFSFFDTRSVAIGMQVCKFWAEVGKPVLWRVVDSDEQFVGLLRMLAPWDFEADEFSRSLSLDWPRFLECSRLVHTLKIDWSSSYYDPDIMVTNIYSVLELISESRPVSDVFPNLHTLVCIAYQDTRHASILLHSGVRRWSIVFINYNERDDPSIPLIPIQRVSGLVELKIGYGVVVNDLLASFLVLKELPFLRTIILPYYTVSYAVLEALSMCQTLQEIRTSSTWESSRACQGEHSLPRPFRKGAFPVLTVLTISGCAYMLSRLLDDEYFPFHITSLAVESSVCSENQSSSACSKIVEKCPHVTDFAFRDIVINKPSPFSSLRGFLSYDLTQLRVDTYLQLAYEVPEIEELARSLPKIEVLYLATTPHKVLDPPFGTFAFNRLCLFARHCRKLTKFAVLVDATRPCEPLTEDSIVPFAILRELDLGRTFVGCRLDNAAAILLARLLPTYCQVTFDRRYRPSPLIIDQISEARAAKSDVYMHPS